MNTMLSSIVSYVFILVGLTAVLIMLKLHGNPKGKTPMKVLRNVHRILGYVFLLYFLLMFVLMIGRLSYVSAEFSPRVTVHMVLALVIVPLFLAKILIARFFKRLFPNLLLLGLSIFILSFTLVGITAGYNIFSAVDTLPAMEKGKSSGDNVNLQVTVKDLIQKKCTICHDLNRVRAAQKNREQWQATMDKMIKYNINADFLSDLGKNLIISYLSSDWKKNL